jgi:hypothetical protein
VFFRKEFLGKTFTFKGAGNTWDGYAKRMEFGLTARRSGRGWKTGSR